MKEDIRLRRRIINNNINLPLNIPPLLRKIYSSRGVRSVADLERSINAILPWQQLNDIEKATNMLYNAFCDDKRIIVIGDFDVDGATSTALSVLCLRAMGCNNIGYLVPNRFENGHGLSPEIVDLVHKNGAQMIMTVDNGISSHTGIERAHQLRIPVLITDHHLPGKVLPQAEALVNPNLHNCKFPSKSLAGVGVAFYLMVALRTLLRDKDWFTSRDISVPNLAQYLDLVALGTVADVVPFDLNNRILTWQGLSRIRTGKCCPGIKALLEITKCKAETLIASDLGFTIGPLLNAAGRINDMSVGVALLLCKNLNVARILANKLNIFNQIRKEIEQKMQIEALNLCDKFEREINLLPSGLAIYHPKWHLGIIGILASYIKKRFYRPVIAFAQTRDGILQGSGRSVQGLHMHNMLEHLNLLYPGLIIQFGGHAMAAGVSLNEKKFHEFQYYFNELVNEWLDPSLLHEEIISDGPLSPKEMTIEVAQMLRDAGPWGPMFPEPSFDGCFRLLQQHIVSKCHLKVMVEPTEGGPVLDGIVFNVDTEVWPNNNISEVKMVYKLNINEFRGNRNLQIIIDNIWPL